jgi:geranylgeranyl diphosphate synthase type I
MSSLPWFERQAHHVDRIRDRMLAELAAWRTPATAALLDKLAGVLRQPAKFVRSLGIVKIATALGGDRERAYTAGAIVEIYHNATLLIDDILDCAEVRRGQPTLRLSAGTADAMALAGVLRSLMYHPLRRDQLFDAAEQGALHALVDEAVTRVTIGQAQETHWRSQHRFDLTDAEYIEMIANKTGALFAASWVLGGRIARAGAEIQAALSDLGLETGVLFQLRNDYLDLFDSREGIRREPYEDLRDGKRTLFTLRCLRTLMGRGEAETAERLRTTLDRGGLSGAEIAECVGLLERTGSIASVRADIHTRASRLRQQIDTSSLPPAVRTDLTAIVELLDLCEPRPFPWAGDVDSEVS